MVQYGPNIVQLLCKYCANMVKIECKYRANMVQDKISACSEENTDCTNICWTITCFAERATNRLESSVELPGATLPWAMKPNLISEEQTTVSCSPQFGRFKQNDWKDNCQKKELKSCSSYWYTDCGHYYFAKCMWTCMFHGENLWSLRSQMRWQYIVFVK